MDGDVVDAIPESWLVTHDRDAYRDWLAERLAWGGFAQEADEELRDAQRLALESISEEPWERWW